MPVLSEFREEKGRVTSLRHLVGFVRRILSFSLSKIVAPATVNGTKVIVVEEYFAHSFKHSNG